jgi:hypothetical protein
MFAPAVLVAFAFGSLPMLGWLAAAAAPILIHLWSRRQYRQTRWAAMEYLLAALRSSRRRIRLEEWFLLALRTAVILLVVLAAAEPLLETRIVTARGQRTHRVLVIDVSYSMGYRPVDKTRFERAKEIAARIVEESSEGDGFTLVLLGQPPRVVVGTPSFDSRDFLKEIQALELPHAGADLPQTLVEVEKVLNNARRETSRLTRTEIYFLTDLGRVGWGLERLDSASLAEFRKRSRRLADAAALTVINLGQPDAENIAVTDFEAVESFATVAKPMEVRAVVKNFGRQSHNRQPVELRADQRRVDQQYIDLPPGGEATVTFSHDFDSPGEHVLEVRAEGDRLEIDNQRWLAVPVKPYLRVLCVDGRPSGDPFRSATGYLVAALAPQSDSAATALVRPDVVPESQLTLAPLEKYDCVFLADIAQFTAGEARMLDAYVQSGGSLVFFLGGQVQAANYNRELGGEAGNGFRLLPARLGEIVANNSLPLARLNPLGYRHPIVQPFRGQEGAGLLSTPVFKYFKLALPKDSKANVVLAIDPHADPLIVEESIHRGRVIVVGTAADDSGWSALPQWPTLVPIVQEVLAYAVGGQIQERNHRVGDILGGSIPTVSGDVRLSVKSPSGRSDVVPLQSEGAYLAWAYPAMVASGIYTAEFGPPLGRSELHAVNVDPQESDLTMLTAEQLRDEVWPGIDFNHQTTWQNLERSPPGPVALRSELPKELLYVVLAMLFLETYLARWFGHYGKA